MLAFIFYILNPTYILATLRITHFPHFQFLTTTMTTKRALLLPITTPAVEAATVEAVEAVEAAHQRIKLLNRSQQPQKQGLTRSHKSRLMAQITKQNWCLLFWVT